MRLVQSNQALKFPKNAYFGSKMANLSRRNLEMCQKWPKSMIFAPWNELHQFPPALQEFYLILKCQKQLVLTCHGGAFWGKLVFHYYLTHFLAKNGRFWTKIGIFRDFQVWFDAGWCITVLPLDTVKKSHFPLWETSGIVGRYPTQFVTEWVILSGLFQIFVSRNHVNVSKRCFFVFMMYMITSWRLCR